ncbi:MAG: hypothetical protein ACFFBP_16235 [Promethearchaeota archaeon]
MGLFLDFDKREKLFYSNLYIDEHKLVVKTPITKDEKQDLEIKIEHFDLTKYTYLVAHE